MQNTQGTAFPQLSFSPKSLAMLEAVQKVFYDVMADHMKNNEKHPSESLFNVGYILLNLEIMGQDYATYWKVFQRAQRDYGYTSLVWNKAFRLKDPIDEKTVLNNWGADPKILFVLQKMAMLVTEFANEDETWEPMKVIIWSIITSMVDPDYHDPMLRDIVGIINDYTTKIQGEEKESPLN